MAININTPAASAFGDLLELALKMGGQSREQQWRSQEAEKDRQFRESQEYLRNMLNQEGLIIEDILQAEDDLTFYNINVEGPMQRLQDFQTDTATAGGLALSQLNGEIKQQRISDLISIRSDLSKMKGRFSEGQSVADVMDINKDNFLDEDEIRTFEGAERARREDPNFTLSEPFVQGARNRIADPDYQLTKLKLAGEKTRQEELKVERVRKERTFEMETSKFKMDLANMYRTNNISSMKGDMSYADYELSSGIHQYFKGMSKAEIFEMIENSPVSYTDRVPGELDYSDLDAIEPQMRGFVTHYLQQRPEAQEFLGITQDDFEATANKEKASDNFNFAIQEGVRNALSGFEQNVNYELRSEFVVSSAQAQEYKIQEGMIKDFEISFQSTIQTLQNHFIDPTTGALSAARLHEIADVLKRDEAFKKNAEKAGVNTKNYITSIMTPLLSQVDPTTVNLLITQSEDLKKIIDTSGLTGMDEMINKALAAKDAVGAKYTPVERISKPERERRKKVTTSNLEYIENITEKYKGQLSAVKSIGLDLIRKGYDPASLQYKTVLLQELSLKLIETTNPNEITILKSSIEALQQEIDKIK